ncbi:MAG: Spy/CpxP family protein refolding chaperone [Bacteroidales bacterium]|nr:Spy/CpxP family protein refolding chaperone [Bacteroidales bacterium]
MKNSGFKATMMVVVMVLASMFSQAQPNRNGCQKGLKAEASCLQHLPDLTDDQKAQIETLRLSQQQSMLETRNQLDVLHAELKVLTTAENADMKAIDKKAEEIGALKTKMAKQRLAHKQEVRKILTKEQRLVFDTKMQHRKGQGRHGHGDCNNNERGNKHRHGHGHGTR